MRIAPDCSSMMDVDARAVASAVFECFKSAPIIANVGYEKL